MLYISCRLHLLFNSFRLNLKYIDNILPLIQEGYANGVLIQEFLSPQIRKNNNYSFTPLQDIYSANIGILYNMNNELKLKEVFKQFYS